MQLKIKVFMFKEFCRAIYGFEPFIYELEAFKSLERGEINPKTGLMNSDVQGFHDNIKDWSNTRIMRLYKIFNKNSLK